MDVHLVHKFLVDFQESVSISEPAELSRTPCLHGSDLQSPAALVHLQVEAEVLPLQALHVAQFGQWTGVRFYTHTEEISTVGTFGRGSVRVNKSHRDHLR